MSKRKNKKQFQPCAPAAARHAAPAGVPEPKKPESPPANHPERLPDAPAVHTGRLNLDRLPVELRARVRRERQQGATWEEIEEMSPGFVEWEQVPAPALALFPGRRLDCTLLQGWHSQRLEQVRREEREASREKATAELHKLAKLLIQNRKLALMEERAQIEKRRMALLESRHEMRLKKMEREALKNEARKNEARKTETRKNNQAKESRKAHEIQAAQGKPGASSVANEMAPDEIPAQSRKTTGVLETDREDGSGAGAAWVVEGESKEEVEEVPLEASSGEAPEEDPYVALAEAHFAATGTRVTPAGLRESHRRMNSFREQDAQEQGIALEQLLATLPYRGGVSRLYDLPYPLRPGEALELAESA